MEKIAKIRLTYIAKRNIISPNMTEQEPGNQITENGKESALRSSTHWIIRKPDLSKSLARYAAEHDSLVEKAEEQFAIVTPEQVLGLTFPTVAQGLRFAFDYLSDQSGIVHRIRRSGIPSSSIYSVSLPMEFFIEKRRLPLNQRSKFSATNAVALDLDAWGQELIRRFMPSQKQGPLANQSERIN